MLRRVAVFCGSKDGTRPAYAQSAHAMGRALLERRIGLVYGGGGVGMMGRIAETVKAGGGEVRGVIPRALLAREGVRTDLAELRRSEEHTSELQSQSNLVCRLLLEKKKKNKKYMIR